jgi:integrase
MSDLVPATPTVPIHRDDVVSSGTAERITAGIPPNTSRSYKTAWRQFERWCTEHGRSALPATPATLADYTAHLCDIDRAPSTIEHRIAVVHRQHRIAGYPKGTPDATAAGLVLRGHQRQRAEAGRRIKEAPPITRDRLRQMSAACDRNTLAGRRDRLLLVIGWALAGRRSELATLRIEDVQVVDSELEILIRSSKTDKGSAGAVVNVPAGEHVDTDPVGLLGEWLSALAECGGDSTTGWLFRAVTRNDRLYRYGKLSPAAVNDVVKRAAKRAGLPQAHLYSAHSLRAGFATQASSDGIPMGIWAEHGRWDKASPVPAMYMRRADRKRDNPLRKMGL